MYVFAILCGHLACFQIRAIMNKAVVIIHFKSSLWHMFSFLLGTHESSWMGLVSLQRHRELSCLLPSCEEVVRVEACSPGTSPPQSLPLLTSWPGNFNLPKTWERNLFTLPSVLCCFLYGSVSWLRCKLCPDYLSFLLFIFFLASHYHEVIVTFVKFGLVIQFILIYDLCAENFILLLINLYSKTLYYLRIYIIHSLLDILTL